MLRPLFVGPQGAFFGYASLAPQTPGGRLRLPWLTGLAARGLNGPSSGLRPFGIPVTKIYVEIRGRTTWVRQGALRAPGREARKPNERSECPALEGQAKRKKRPALSHRPF